MIAKLVLLKITVALALMAHAAPVTSHLSAELSTFRERAVTARPEKRVSVPWKWVGATAAGALLLDHIGFQRLDEEPSAPGAPPAPERVYPIRPVPQIPPGFEYVPGPYTSPPVPESPPAPERVYPIRPVPQIPPGFEYVPGPYTSRPAPEAPPASERVYPIRPVPQVPPGFENSPGPGQRSSKNLISPSRTSFRRDGNLDGLASRAIPWRWAIPSVLAGAITDHLLSHSFKQTHRPAQLLSYPPPSPQLYPQQLPQPQSPAMASTPLPDTGEVLQARGFITTRNGVEKMAQSLGSGAARKVLLKWLGIGILGGTAFDHVLFSLPLPYLHSGTNIRAVQEDGGMSCHLWSEAERP